MSDIRKLMETLEKIEEANILSVENEEVEEYLDAAAKALAKDAVLQASGVWDEEGDGEGRFHTGATTGKEYVSIAAPRFLDDEYKSSIMAAFQNSFDNYVQYFLEYISESVEQINEVSDFDGPVDKLIAQFEETCIELGIEDNIVKRKELLQVVMARGFENK